MNIHDKSRKIVRSQSQTHHFSFLKYIYLITGQLNPQEDFLLIKVIKQQPFEDNGT